MPPHMQYIRELVFRSARVEALDRVFVEIQEMKKRVQQLQKEAELKRDIVKQEKLRLDPQDSSAPRLKDVNVRPAISRKKGVTGTVTAHLNGLRYRSSDNQHIDVIYDNVAFAIFQPATQKQKQNVDTHSVIIHFELKNPILLDSTAAAKSRKTTSVQFFFNVFELSEDLSTANRYRDDEGLQEEQLERQRRKKWNEKFRTFARALQDVSHGGA